MANPSTTQTKTPRKQYSVSRVRMMEVVILLRAFGTKAAMRAAADFERQLQRGEKSTYVCEGCGEVREQNKRGKHRRYCSDACRQKEFRIHRKGQRKRTYVRAEE